MKYIKTFESFSINEEEGLFKNLMRGAKTVKVDDATYNKLKPMYCNVIEGGKETKGTAKGDQGDPIFTMEGEKVTKGHPGAMRMYNNLKTDFKMEEKEALAAVMGIYAWNGIISLDPKESKFDKAKKEFTAVPGESTRGSGFNN